jgi:hypothetical protein
MSHKLISLLRDSIKACIASKNESLRWLVKQADANYPVVYRITSGEQNTITFFQAYKLLKYLQPKTYMSTLGEYFPNETKEFFPSGRDSEAEEQSSDEKVFSEIIRDQFLYEVFLFIRAGNTLMKKVEAEFGGRGLLAIETLQELGAITIGTEGSIHSIFDSFIVSEDALIKQHAVRNVDLVDLRVAGTALFSYSAGLNAAGIAAAWQLEQSHWKQMKEILEKDEFRGTTPVVVTGLVGPVAKGGNKQ